MPPKSVNVPMIDDEAGNGKKWKMALLKVVGTVVVAMLGLLGAGLGYLAQVKTGNTDAALRATVEQLNTRTIPLLETLLKEQRGESSKLRDKLSETCERLAYLEAYTKSLGSKARVKPPAMGGGTFSHSTGVTHIMAGPLESKPDKMPVKKPEDLIPRLKVQLQQKAE